MDDKFCTTGMAGDNLIVLSPPNLGALCTLQVQNPVSGCVQMITSLSITASCGVTGILVVTVCNYACI